MLGLRDVVVLTPSPSSLHHHQHQQPTNHHPNIPFPSSAAALGIFPFLTAGPADCGDAGGGNFWRTVRMNQESRKDAAAVEEVEAEEKIGSGASSLRACEDCGNRAKRDCSFRRCRTCCKSRGYDCSTHLKSTWVPAAVRRDRHVTVAIGGTGGGGCSTGSSSGANKRPRMAVSPQNATSASHTSTSNNAAAATTRTFPTASYHQDASFKERLPGQVNAPAVFRCIRVTAINDEEAELGYQATATISGHVFKGFLYDQGVDEKNAFPCISEMHLHNSGRARNGASSSSPIVDPSSGAFASSGGRGLMLKGDS